MILFASTRSKTTKDENGENQVGYLKMKIVKSLS